MISLMTPWWPCRITLAGLGLPAADPLVGGQAREGRWRVPVWRGRLRPGTGVTVDALSGWRRVKPPALTLNHRVGPGRSRGRAAERSRVL